MSTASTHTRFYAPCKHPCACTRRRVHTYTHTQTAHTHAFPHRPQECCTEFIGFITSEASDRCHQEKRKTINGEDILWAMQSLGFDPYIEPLKQYLQAYREVCVLSLSLSLAR